MCVCVKHKCVRKLLEEMLQLGILLPEVLAKLLIRGLAVLGTGRMTR